MGINPGESIFEKEEAPVPKPKSSIKKTHKSPHMNLYHGSNEKPENVDDAWDMIRADYLYLTKDEDIASEYGKYVYILRIPSKTKIARKDVMIDIGKELGFDWIYEYELVHRGEIIQELKNRGYEAAWFNDETPYGKSHDTLVVFDLDTIDNIKITI